MQKNSTKMFYFNSTVHESDFVFDKLCTEVLGKRWQMLQILSPSNNLTKLYLFLLLVIKMHVVSITAG